jgi:hypothetical protein
MQERVLPRGWIERRSNERRCDADTPVRILWAALSAYGQPTARALARRGIWMALDLRVLTKPNRSRKVRSRQTSPTK